ncbi:hypothetical protein C7B76_25875 [filamentous cyanobacterium CCP2]|nr:hypothetical protein C7B76_25875 [filamentous cyanobacterium CCP2]
MLTLPATKPRAPHFAMPEFSSISSNYHDRLHPWCIICCLPNAQTLIIQRFRQRNNAEAHLRVLRQMNPKLR